jgi:ATP-binding cassette subfamily B protein
MSRTFPLYRQRDAMDCGPTCLLMVSAYYGKRLTLPYLRERSHISREGVSALGIQEAAKVIGLNPMTVKVPFKSSNGEASLLEAPLPAIAHWNQSHFVVIYKANKKNDLYRRPSRWEDKTEKKGL